MYLKTESMGFDTCTYMYVSNGAGPGAVACSGDWCVSVEQKAKSVVGIELVKEAIDDAKHNAQLNSKRQRLVRNRLFYVLIPLHSAQAGNKDNKLCLNVFFYRHNERTILLQ